MRLRIALVILLIGILFPMGWPGGYSAAYSRAFDAIFAPEWTHLLAHSLLYAALAVLVISVFRLAFSARSLFVLAGVVLGVGVLQEIFQALSGGQGGLPGALFDLCVDLAGAGMGALLIWGFYPRLLKMR